MATKTAPNKATKKSRKPVTAPLPEGIATVPQAIAFLGKSRSTVIRMLEADVIRGVKTGRLWEIDARSLYAYRDRKFPKPSR